MKNKNSSNRNQRMTRTVESFNNQGDFIKSNQVKLYPTHQHGETVEERTKKDRIKQKIERLLNMLKTGIKSTTTNIELYNFLAIECGLNIASLKDIFAQITKNEKDSKKAIFDYLDMTSSKATKTVDAVVQRQVLMTKHKSLINRKSPLFRVVQKISTTPFSGDLSKQNPTTMRVGSMSLGGGHDAPIWGTPGCPPSVPQMLNQIDLKIAQNIWLSIYNKIIALYFNRQPAHQVKGSNENYVKSAEFYVGYDFEWVMSESVDDKGNDFKERKLEDVLSMQLAVYNPKTKQHNNIIVHNEQHVAFTFREFYSAIETAITPLLPVNDNGLVPNNIKIMLLGYYGGVDLTAMSGFQREMKKLTVINKNYVFSNNPVVKTWTSRLNTTDGDIKNKSNNIRFSITTRDVGLLAPPGGLASLGDAIGMPKLDTAKLSHDMGYPDSDDGDYYKTHMDVLRKDNREFYNRYAMNDAIITLEYYLQSLEVFKDWKKLQPATIGSYSAHLVYEELLLCWENRAESMIDLDKYNKTDIVATSSVKVVRPELVNAYMNACDSYYGGLNVAFMSGVLNGQIIDTDLVSAYNINGLLLGKPDMTDAKFPFINDSDIEKYWMKASFKLDSNNDFAIIANLMKNNPFVFGNGNFEIDYPEDTKMVGVPFHSENADYGPCYVLHGTSDLTLIDAYNAYQHGATVKINNCYVYKQNPTLQSTYGHVQGKLLDKRNKAKKAMKNAKTDKEYRKYYFRQLLLKLCANALYGKSGQGLSATKRVRNFDTDETGDVPYCGITNPVIAGSYTAFTRYLVTILYDAVEKVHPNVVPMNITTDGYTFKLPRQPKFDEISVRREFLKQLPSYYLKRLKKHFSSVLGFELKGNVVDSAFNIKTRLNGTPNHDESQGGIKALASMRGLTTKEVFDAITNGDVVVNNKEFRLTNATDLKHNHVKNKHGHQEVWEQAKQVPIQYDFAYYPTKYHKTKKQCYFETKPFKNVHEHDSYKEKGMKIARTCSIYQNKRYFDDFKQTMKNAFSLVPSKNFDVHKMDDVMIYAFKQFASRNYNPTSNQELYKLGAEMNYKKSTLKKHLQRNHDLKLINLSASDLYEFGHLKMFD